MALSDLKAKRKGLMQAFTLNLKKIESELNKEIADRKELSVLRTLIDDKFQRLDNCQLLLSEELLKEENGSSYFLKISKKLKRIETDIWKTVLKLGTDYKKTLRRVKLKKGNSNYQK
ncbi:hypothetical protein TNCV_1358131 [Trichonephila clavipes]|uniref:Uncharacterized protein n=1 Tax=Trichonephila clavipes TaxID=2585209 RepID=A0A8X6V836_TRICX|nr:hypothetical protein TNCV_1358131 [Trichonephila clavipes]